MPAARVWQSLPVAMAAAPSELKVFISTRRSTCAECDADLGSSAWITLREDRDALCLACADLDHLEFLPSGNAAVTRRAKKLSTLSAVVLKWSRARRRYERQGLLVEVDALDKAEASSLEDAELRRARNDRRAAREADRDRQYIAQFAAAVRQRYPSCPDGRENEIAEHACRKYSGRIGRTKDAKALNPEAIDLAVHAHARHRQTNYDQLLAQGYERHDARTLVASEVASVLETWRL